MFNCLLDEKNKAKKHLGRMKAPLSRHLFIGLDVGTISKRFVCLITYWLLQIIIPLCI